MRKVRRRAVSATAMVLTNVANAGRAVRASAHAVNGAEKRAAVPAKIVSAIVLTNVANAEHVVRASAHAVSGAEKRAAVPVKIVSAIVMMTMMI